MKRYPMTPPRDSGATRLQVCVLVGVVVLTVATLCALAMQILRDPSALDPKEEDAQETPRTQSSRRHAGGRRYFDSPDEAATFREAIVDPTRTLEAIAALRNLVEEPRDGLSLWRALRFERRIAMPPLDANPAESAAHTLCWLAREDEVLRVAALRYAFWCERPPKLTAAQLEELAPTDDLLLQVLRAHVALRCPLDGAAIDFHLSRLLEADPEGRLLLATIANALHRLDAIEPGIELAKRLASSARTDVRLRLLEALAEHPRWRPALGDAAHILREDEDPELRSRARRARWIYLRRAREFLDDDIVLLSDLVFEPVDENDAFRATESQRVEVARILASHIRVRTELLMSVLDRLPAHSDEWTRPPVEALLESLPTDSALLAFLDERLSLLEPTQSAVAFRHFARVRDALQRKRHLPPLAPATGKRVAFFLESEDCDISLRAVTLLSFEKEPPLAFEKAVRAALEAGGDCLERLEELVALCAENSLGRCAALARTLGDIVDDTQEDHSIRLRSLLLAHALDGLEDAHLDLLIEPFVDPNGSRELRERCAAVLPQLGERARPMARRIGRVLENCDPFQLQLCRTLAGCVDEELSSPQMTFALAQRLADEDSAVIQAALGALLRMRNTSEPLRARLQGLLQSESPDTLRACLRLVRASGPPTHGVRVALEALLRDHADVLLRDAAAPVPFVERLLDFDTKFSVVEDGAPGSDTELTRENYRDSVIFETFGPETGILAVDLQVSRSVFLFGSICAALEGAERLEPPTLEALDRMLSEGSLEHAIDVAALIASIGSLPDEFSGRLDKRLAEVWVRTGYQKIGRNRWASTGRVAVALVPRLSDADHPDTPAGRLVSQLAMHSRELLEPIAAVLGRMQPLDDDLLERILDARRSQKSERAALAAVALRGPELADRIEDELALLDRDIPSSAHALPRVEHQVQIIELLGNLASRPERVLPRLGLALRDRDANVRRAAARAIGDYRQDAAALVDDLIARLADEDRRVRFEAVRSLGRIGTAARRAVDAIRASMPELRTQRELHDLRTPPARLREARRVLETLERLGEEGRR